MSRTAAEVVVVGAGPAGVAAAIELARAGRDVLVVDKARFPRDKCCGDGLTTGALRLLEHLGLDPATVPSWQAVDDVTLRSPSGRQVDLPLPRHRGTYAAVARRSELDAALVDLARAGGVRVVEGAALTGATAGADGVALQVDTLGTVEARYVVGADGVWSPLRKALGAGVPGYLGEWQAFRRYYHSVGPAADRLHVWFEPDLLPGYAWSFPLAGGRANVGFGVLRETTPSGGLANLWSALVERPHVRAVLGPDATPVGPHKAWPIPTGSAAVRLEAAGGRALFVGDAAAAGDPMTGEGIGQALLSGVAGRPGHRRRRPRRPRRRRPALPPRRPRRAGGRRPPLGSAGSGAPPAVGGTGGRTGGGVDRLDPPSLRPLALRGLPPGLAGHAVEVAAALPRGRRRLGALSGHHGTERRTTPFTASTLP